MCAHPLAIGFLMGDTDIFPDVFYSSKANFTTRLCKTHGISWIWVQELEYKLLTLQSRIWIFPLQKSRFSFSILLQQISPGTCRWQWPQPDPAPLGSAKRWIPSGGLWKSLDVPAWSLWFHPRTDYCRVCSLHVHQAITLTLPSAVSRTGRDFFDGHSSTQNPEVILKSKNSPYGHGATTVLSKRIRLMRNTWNPWTRQAKSQERN